MGAATRKQLKHQRQIFYRLKVLDTALDYSKI